MINRKIMRLYFPCFFISACIACSHRSSEKASDRTTDTIPPQSAVTRPVSPVILLDTTGMVKGYETHKYKLPVEFAATYTVTVSSENIGFIFVIQSENGENVVNETYPSWTGELKKGEYTIIVGLMRNAARKDQKGTPYSIEVKRL